VNSSRICSAPRENLRKKSERPERGSRGQLLCSILPAFINETDVPIDRRGALFASEQSRNPKWRHSLRQEGGVLLAFRQAEIAPQTHPQGGKDPTNNMLLALRRKRRIFVNLIPALRTKRAHIDRLNVPRPPPSARSDDSHAPAERSEHVPLRHLPARKQFRQIFFRK
jgi:hypothetical protein